MSPVAIAFVVLACVFGGALLVPQKAVSELQGSYQVAVVAILLQVLFYTCPIVYPESYVPVEAHIGDWTIPLRDIYNLNYEVVPLMELHGGRPTTGDQALAARPERDALRARALTVAGSPSASSASGRRSPRRSPPARRRPSGRPARSRRRRRWRRTARARARGCAWRPP